jgi:hypothetical protein
MPSLLQDIAFAERLKAAAPDAVVFLFGAAIMATIDQWLRATAVDYVLYGEPEAFFAERWPPRILARCQASSRQATMTSPQIGLGGSGSASQCGQPSHSSSVTPRRSPRRTQTQSFSGCKWSCTPNTR